MLKIKLFYRKLYAVSIWKQIWNIYKKNPLVIYQNEAYKMLHLEKIPNTPIGGKF